jgi:hypothetical protein
MLESHLTDIFAALNKGEVRYLVVGGLAVIAHGHVRGTVDLDLVVALDAMNAQKTLEALGTLGYRPRAPVNASDFASPQSRDSWLHEKGMLVFQLVSPRQEETAVDLFIREPFDFAQEYASAPRIELIPGIETPVVRYETLLAMKRNANRPKDIEDIRNLELARQTLEPGQDFPI